MLQPTVKYSGAHVHKNVLKAGIALFPGEGGLSYPRHYVARPVIPEGGYPGEVDERGGPLDAGDYRNWLASLPTQMVLNPCLVHFIRIGPDTTLPQLEAAIQRIFTPDLVATVDALLATRGAGERADMSRLRRLMNSPERLGSGPVLPAGYDRQVVIAAAEGRFRGLAGELDGGGRLMGIDPGTIDIGPGAIDRPSTWNTTATTNLCATNPANDSGTLDTIELWYSGNTAGVIVGTFYGSNPNFTNRDYEEIGSVSGGSKQVFSGLDMDVATDDIIGVYSSATGYIERTNSGVGVCQCSGAQFGTGQQTYTCWSGYDLSIYGTGSDAATNKTSSDTGTGADALASRLSGPADAGAGAEASDLNTAGEITTGDSGVGAEAAAALAAIAASDSGAGADYNVQPGGLTGADSGWGRDRILLRIERAGAGTDMSLPGRRGRTSIPNKEASR